MLDVLLRRSPHAVTSRRIWAAIERGRAEGYVPAHTVTTVFYLTRKALGTRTALACVSSMLEIFQVARIDKAVLDAALQLVCPDYEDAVCAAAALHAGCTLIVTRDPAGFVGSPVPPIEPAAALAVIGSR